jgi:hypothetical protein
MLEVSSAGGMGAGMPEPPEESTAQQSLPDGFGHEDFTAMIKTHVWAVVRGAVVEDLPEHVPEVVNAEVGDAIEDDTTHPITPCCCCTYLRSAG